MFKEAHYIKDKSAEEADICIVGAGAAGIAFAREFAGSPMRIIMLESGPLHGPQDSEDSLLEIETTALKVGKGARARGFGGTMARWAGKWKSLDSIDFTERSWIPLSGWPIDAEMLKPYYKRASESLHAPDLFAEHKTQNLLAGEDFEATPFLVQDKKHISWDKTFYNDFAESKNILVHSGAHVTEFIKKGGAIESAQVQTKSGGYSVRAKVFILACGGIENARQLLISQIGNEHDQAGRYFMDHPKGRLGVVECFKPIDLTGYFETNGDASFVGLRLSERVQQQEEVLNSHVFLEPAYETTLANKIQRRVFGKTKTSVIVVRNYLEQAPVASNRVTLSDNKDMFGLPKARLEWQLSELDKKTMRVFHRHLREALEESGIGLLQSPLLDSPDAPFPNQDAYHHMGTTRMGTDPKLSVTDPSCKVHGTGNLFIAGSSLFPTGGHANPTATICALAIRLADHIKEIV